jgi:catechol 2,3-dioxygenase-like lactoylglutathione lyase family enzyme
LRIYDLAKTREFYVDFLGFSIDWEHRFDDNAPLYMQVSRGGVILHLSQHHGDGSPNQHVRIQTAGIEALHAELTAKTYRYMRPGLEHAPWGERSVGVIDPVGNQLYFFEPDAKP